MAEPGSVRQRRFRPGRRRKAVVPQADQYPLPSVALADHVPGGIGLFVFLPASPNQRPVIILSHDEEAAWARAADFAKRYREGEALRLAWTEALGCRHLARARRDRLRRWQRGDIEAMIDGAQSTVHR